MLQGHVLDTVHQGQGHSSYDVSVVSSDLWAAGSHHGGVTHSGHVDDVIVAACDVIECGELLKGFHYLDMKCVKRE